MIFDNMFKELSQTSEELKLITQSQYNIWRDVCIFDAMKGLRYGQSFCNHFDITDNILFYSDQLEFCHQYICKTYLKGGH